MRYPGYIATFLATVLAAAGLVGSNEGRAQDLVADLSSHLVSVTAGFSGTDLLLFGSTAEEGDVVVVVRGPDAPVVVRRKARTSVGVWINSDEVVFSGVPSFYRVASSRPLEVFKRGRVLDIHQIGVGKLQFGVSEALTEAEVAQFRSALVRNKQRQGLFSDQPVLVNFLGRHLFRARVGFPSNVPTGTYTVTVYLIRSGKVIGAQTIPLAVSKIGIGARIYDFAHQNSAAYGIVAILLALFAGWLGSVIFRKA